MPSTPPPFFAALAVVGLTMAILAWRRPLAALRFALSPPVLIFTAGAALLVGRLAEAHSPAVVLIAAVSLAGIISVTSRANELGLVRRLIRNLADPRRRDRSRRQLTSWATLALPGPSNRAAMRWYAPMVCSAAGALLAADASDEAAHMLARLPRELPEPRLAAARTTLLTMAYLSRGRHDDAEAAFALAPESVDHVPSKQLLDAAGALLLAVKGRADAALAAIEGLSRDPQLLGLVLAVEAHARAKRGERERAKAALGQLRDAGGSQALDRVRAHDGPASELAASFER